MELSLIILNQMNDMDLIIQGNKLLNFVNP